VNEWSFDIGFLTVRWVDILDVALVSFLLYQLYKLVRGSVAFRIFTGFITVYLAYWVVRALQMELLTAILGQFIGVGVLALIILFQQEIRKFLLMVGRSTFMREDGFLSFFFKRHVNQQQTTLQPVLEAAKSLTNNETGALIVFAKTDELRYFEENGDLLDAIISKRLLISIFNKNSPLHDGAVIIRNGRVRAARCILPVTDKTDLPAQYGLRHRAALGISEVTDAVVLIVSEETGQLALAHEGILETNLSIVELRARLGKLLFAKPIAADSLTAHLRHPEGNHTSKDNKDAVNEAVK
jgi:uncharacterized protein (TIGR00159 family)